MSHVATNWLASIAPDAMTPAEFRVMFHLCDCHNPSQGCFPSQKYLIERTGLSNGGLNKALLALENKGLIRRRRDRDERTKRQLVTHYILGFEFSEEQEPSPLSGDGMKGEHHDSRLHSVETEPTPLSSRADSTQFTSRLHSVESYNKDEPVKEPVNEPCAQARTREANFDFDGFVDRFMEAHPRPGSRSETEEALRSAIDDGADPEQLIRAAEAYGREQAGNSPAYVAYSENWLRKGRWAAYVPKPRPSDDEINAAIAGLIRKRNPALCRSISSTRGRELIAMGLVSEDDCREAGVL